MKILIKNTNEEYLETISLNDLNNIENFFKESSKKGPFKVIIFAINESISSNELSKLKNNILKLNIFSLCIYSNNRDTIIAGKSQKIDTNFVKEQEIKKKLLLFNTEKKDNIFYKGTVRSGDRISSNGDLCIIGDVNPGAIVSAKRNIYVWGKLLGIAFAGKEGDHNASIASLYLNPLQLRIADIVAIGPKDKPKNYYPEIAILENQIITINPYIVETKN
nr:septum site-determining protein MinC [Prochlorococcus marinus]